LKKRSRELPGAVGPRAYSSGKSLEPTDFIGSIFNDVSSSNRNVKSIIESMTKD
jgi:hypothetical protein